MRVFSLAALAPSPLVPPAPGTAAGGGSGGSGGSGGNDVAAQSEGCEAPALWRQVWSRTASSDEVRLYLFLLRFL